MVQSSDGIISNAGTSYNSVWAANEGDVDSGGTTLAIGQDYQSFVYFVWRSFVFFDTSSLPDTVTIDSAVLSLYGHTDYSGSDFSIVVQNGQPTYPHDPLIESNYNKDHYAGSGGSFNTQYFTTSGYNDINLNSNGISWINKQGTTKFCLRSSRDIDENKPDIWESVLVDSAEGPNIPKLTVEYTNNPPDKPQQPFGETKGEVGVEYTYTTSTTDPEGEQVYFQWRWGDDTQSSWLGPFNSGEEASATKV